MTSLEQILTPAERQFLARHDIALSLVVDARGLSTAQRKATMRQEGMLIAVGAPCQESGHRLRTSSGHCVVCDPKKIAFARRHRQPGQVYVASSRSTGLIKVGSAGDAQVRIGQLNNERYAGCADWKLQFAFDSLEAGKLEFDAHRILAGARASANYIKDGFQTECYEVFRCSVEAALTALKGLSGKAATSFVEPAIAPGPPSIKSISQQVKGPWPAGYKVKHPSRPEWGVGVVLEDSSDERVRVKFSNAGEKVLVPSLAKLVCVDP